MFQCVHFWGWKALESSADHSDAAAPKEMTGFPALRNDRIPEKRRNQYLVNRSLAFQLKKHPEL